MRERVEIPQDRHRPLFHRLELDLSASEIDRARTTAPNYANIEANGSSMHLPVVSFTPRSSRCLSYVVSWIRKKQEDLLLFVSSMPFIVLFWFVPVHLAASSLWTTTTAPG